MWVHCVSEVALKALHNIVVEATAKDCEAALLYAPRRVGHYGNCASNVRFSEYDTEATFRESRCTGLGQEEAPVEGFQSAPQAARPKLVNRAICHHAGASR